MQIAKLHIQQAQAVIDSMRKLKIVGYAVSTLDNFFIVKGHKPSCKCKRCPILRKSGKFLF